MKLAIRTFVVFGFAAMAAASSMYFYGPRMANIEKPGRYIFDIGVMSEHGSAVFFVAEDMNLRFFIPAERKSIDFAHTTMEYQTGVTYRAKSSTETHDFVWINKTKTLFRKSKTDPYARTEIKPIKNPWTVLWPYMNTMKTPNKATDDNLR